MVVDADGVVLFVTHSNAKPNLETIVVKIHRDTERLIVGFFKYVANIHVPPPRDRNPDQVRDSG
jgi:hypothetical protein